MKTKLFLALISLNGLLLSASSASAYMVSTPENSSSISNLSHTISELIDLDLDDISLVAAAIDRALLAKGERNINENTIPIPTGGATIETDRQPIINGKVANPSHRPLINGIIIKDRPQINPSGDKKPIINGRIINSNKK